MKFTKMNGLGNDYIFINLDTEKVVSPSDLSVRLCDRNRSIGGDGIVLIYAGDDTDVVMRIYNSDGTEGLMCGNALRCAGKYAYEELGIKKEIVSVLTASGIRYVRNIVINGHVECSEACLGTIRSDCYPVELSYGGRIFSGYKVSVGNPHYVVPINSFPVDFIEVGEFLSKNKIFNDGANVELFLKNVENNIIVAIVYERGSGVTLSCGTGAGAVYHLCRRLGMVGDSAIVRLPGGDLICSYRNGNYYINGKIQKNFEGEVDING